MKYATIGFIWAIVFIFDILALGGAFYAVSVMDRSGWWLVLSILASQGAFEASKYFIKNLKDMKP